MNSTTCPIEDAKAMTQSDPDAAIGSEFVKELESMLVTKLAGRIAQVHLIESVDGLTLQGCCTTFHAKQLAQELLKQHGCSKSIANCLTVRYVGSHVPESHQ